MSPETEKSIDNILPEEERPSIEELKMDINQFLWIRLNPDTSLFEAEKMALKIFELIQENWDLWEAARK